MYGQFVLLCFVTLGSYGLLRIFRTLAVPFDLYDVPNHRSSHSKPVLRGAGLSFALCFILSCLVFMWLGLISSATTAPLVIGALILSLLGFVDDIFRVKSLVRFSVQILCSIFVLFLVTEGFKQPFEVRFLPFDFSFISIVFGVLFIGWVVNLFNFMDGIDGLVASCSVLIGFFSAGFSHFYGDIELSLLYLTLSVSVGPFLFMNWQPARLFMGDSGAYFLGAFFAIMACIGKVHFGQSLVIPSILMGALVCDATATLLVRAYCLKKLWLPHRTHGFQKLMDLSQGDHQYVVKLYLGLTIFWFFPFACLSFVFSQYSVFFCLLSYAPVLLFHLFQLRVGRPCS